MENRTFKKITKDTLTEYGFQYYNKKFYMLLDNIIIQIQYMTCPFDKGFFLDFNIIIKNLSNLKSDSLKEIADAFEDVSEIPVQMPVLEHIEVSVNKKRTNLFQPFKIDEEFWKQELNKSLCELFDPFKKNDLNEMNYLVFKAPDRERIIVNDKVKRFLSNY